MTLNRQISIATLIWRRDVQVVDVHDRDNGSDVVRWCVSQIHRQGDIVQNFILPKLKNMLFSRSQIFKQPMRHHLLRSFQHLPWPVWPDWAIYWTLGNFLKPLATINLPKFLGNFCIGVKSYHFSCEIIFGHFFRHLEIFSGHTDLDQYIEWTCLVQI